MNYNEIFHKLVVETEGFYSNDKNDPGGETVLGLTRKADPDWQGWAIVNQYRGKTGFPKNLPYDVLRAMAAPYYKKVYWDPFQLDKLPIEVAYQMFDIAVNMGKSIAVMILQKSLNVLNHNGKDYPDIEPDGIFGSKTLYAVLNNKNPEVLSKYMNSLQGARYVELASKNPKLETFTNGWGNRL